MTVVPGFASRNPESAEREAEGQVVHVLAPMLTTYSAGTIPPHSRSSYLRAGGPDRDEVIQRPAAPLNSPALKPVLPKRSPIRSNQHIHPDVEGPGHMERPGSC